MDRAKEDFQTALGNLLTRLANEDHGVTAGVLARAMTDKIPITLRLTMGDLYWEVSATVSKVTESGHDGIGIGLYEKVAKRAKRVSVIEVEW